MTTSSAPAPTTPVIPLALPRMDQDERAIELPGEYGPVVDAESRQLSERYGLEDQRVRPILERLVDPRSRPGRSPTLRRAFHRALQSFSPEEALALFERVDPAALAVRDEQFASLAAVPDLCCSLDELTRLIEAWLAHRYRDRDLSIETGWPRRPFARSPRLELLSVLYPMKLPVETWDFNPGRLWVPESSGPGAAPPSGDVEYRYTWSPVPGPLFVHRDGTIFRDLNMDEPVRPCSHSEAVLIPGIPIERAAQVAADRERILRFRLDLLESCASGIRSRDPERLLHDAFKLLRQRHTEQMLQEHEGLYYLSLLSAADLYEAGPNTMWHPVPRMARSGLWSFIEFVGHCEGELRVGMFSQMCSLLNDQAPGFNVSEGYFALAARTGFPRADALLNAYTALADKAGPFWADFSERVLDAWSTVFSMSEMTVSMMIPREMESRARQLLTGIQEVIESQCESGALLLAFSSPAEEDARQPFKHENGNQVGERYVFQIDGKILKFKYKGDEHTLPVWQGDRYIAYIMSLEGRRIKPLTLVGAVAGTIAPPDPSPYSDLPQDVLEEDEGLRLGGLDSDAEPTEAELKGRPLYLNAIKELEGRVASYTDQGSPEKALEAKTQAQHLKNILDHDFGRGGRPRKVAPAQKRAYDNVRTDIRRSRNRIRLVDSEFAELLRSAIRFQEGEYWFEWREESGWIL